jgi:hypothetical protein
MWEEARQLGFLEPSRMVMDGVGGAVGGAVAYGSAVALTNVARQLGVLPWNSGPDPVITLRYMPSGPGKGYELIGISRKPIAVSESMYDTFLVLLATKGIDAAARFLLNQTDNALTGQLNGAAYGNQP